MSNNNVAFDPRNGFYNAFVKQPDFAKPTSEESAEAVNLYVKDNPQYEYGNIDYNKFSEAYVSQGWECRKFVVLIGFSYELIRTVVIIAKVSLTFPQGFTRGWTCVKVDLYRIGRSIEAGAGWIVTFFDDRYGSFLIHRSKFHLKCYDCIDLFESRSSNRRRGNLGIPDKPWDNLDSHQIPVSAKNHSLWKLYRASHAERHELEVAYRLRNKIREIDNKLNIDFYKRLGKLREQLEVMKLNDLLLPFDESTVPWILRTEDEFKKAPLQEVHYVYPEVVKIVRERLWKLHDESSEEESKTFSSMKSAGTQQLGDVLLLDCHLIKDHIETLPSTVLSLCSDEQVKLLEVGQLSHDQCKWLFWARTPAQIQTRLNKYQVEDVQQAIKDNKLVTSVLVPLPDKFLNRMVLSELSQPVVSAILPTGLNGLTAEGLKSRLSLFEPEDVNAAVKNNLILGKERLGALSDKHYPALEIHRISHQQIKDLFPEKRGMEFVAAKRHFALIGQHVPILQDPVKRAVEEGIVKDAYHLSLLSLEQRIRVGIRDRSTDYLQFLLHTDTAEPTVQKATVAAWPAGDVFDSIKAGHLKTRYQMGLIPIEHFKSCPLGELNSDKISDLFPYTYDFSENRRRFTEIKPDEVSKAFGGKLLSDYTLTLLSGTQLKEIFKNFTLNDVVGRATQLDSFFPCAGGEPTPEDIERFRSFPKDQIEAAIAEDKVTSFIKTLYARAYPPDV